MAKDGRRSAAKSATQANNQELQQRLQALVSQRRFAEAIVLLNPIVSADRRNPMLLHLMADLLDRNGECDQAELWFRRAIKAAPDQPASYMHLADMLRKQQRLEDAEKVLRKAARAVPGSALTHGYLGAVLQELEKFTEARECMQRSAKLDPTNPKIHNNLGVVQHRLGHPAEALSCYEHALRLAPTYSEAQRNLARYWRHMGDRERAEPIYCQLVDEHPESFECARELAEYYLEEGRSEEAMPLYSRFESSTDSKVLETVGSTLQELGRIGKGNEVLQAALAANPSSGIAWFHSVLAMEKTHLQEVLPIIHQALADETDDEMNRLHLAFALGRAYERLKLPAESFRYLSEGNALRRCGYDYDTARDHQHFEAIKDTFRTEEIKRWQSGGFADATPIFILGMPRSGTTLVEQILSSHPEVFGAGELTLLPKVVHEHLTSRGGFPAGVASLTDVERYAMGKDYVEGLRRFSTQARYITDKMPHNFFRVGLIRAILPAAKIIHCRRDPRDNCWSIFKQNFSGYHPYAYDLKELGQYHRMYQDLMTHWQMQYEGELLDLDYESLVAEPQKQIRDILAFCDLEWNEACLAFHQQDRSIRTASKLQVRQPMYQSSVASWEQFREQLDPLLEVLEA